MAAEYVIGVDLGGTNVSVGLVGENKIRDISTGRINGRETAEKVMHDLFMLIDYIMSSSVGAIGIGVPSVVDLNNGIVYDVQHIPSWKEVPLKKILEDRYQVPVLVNNDSNCFALGEHYFGQGKGFGSMIGLTIGTGLGAGVIVNNHLYAGANCGAGEFGMADYLDHNYEYYASGSFFRNVHHLDGEEVFKKAVEGDAGSIKLYEELGTHLGNAIRMMLYTYDVELIVLGGSVRHAYSFFSRTMWERINIFAYKKSLERFQIRISELQNSGVLGAAALWRERLSC